MAGRITVMPKSVYLTHISKMQNYTDAISKKAQSEMICSSFWVGSTGRL